MTRRRNQRKLRNYLLKPALQFRYGFYLFAMTVTVSMVIQMQLVYTLQQSLVASLAAIGLDPYLLAQAVTRPLRTLAVRTAMLTPMVGLLCVGFAIYATHRFVGPQVTLKRHVRALIAGDYDSVCRLRAKDELGEMAEVLNELAKSLKKRHDVAEHPERKVA